VRYFIPKGTPASRHNPAIRVVDDQWSDKTTERDVWFEREEVDQNSGCMIFKLPKECFPYDLIEVFRVDVVEV